MVSRIRVLATMPVVRERNLPLPETIPPIGFRKAEIYKSPGESIEKLLYY
jgi:hypothetical protein